MKAQFYFQHDENASQDEKILDLRAAMGWQGYGLYWALIEWLHKEGGTLEFVPKRMALYLNTTDVIVERICTEFNLFVIEGGLLRSDRLTRQLEYRQAISNKRRKAGKKAASAKQVLNKSAAPEPPKERQRKVKQRIPSQDEVVEYFAENGYREDVALRAFAYYDANQWKDGAGRPVKAWKQKMIGVWFKDENRQGTATSMSVIDMAKKDFYGTTEN